MRAQSNILVINAGSSSVKFQLFSQHSELKNTNLRILRPSLRLLRSNRNDGSRRLHSELTLLVKGSVTHLGQAPIFIASVEADNRHEESLLPIDATHETAIRFILNWIETQKAQWKISVVTHRVVHGGTQFNNSVHITKDILAHLWALNSLAPLHQPHNLAAVEIISELMPDVMQIACFDTAFHANHKPLFTEYALPQWLRDKGIRRYGFHGLSYEWLVHALQLQSPKLAKGRIIAAHLGNGASLCAINNGVSIDTTMGMTALDGLPMGTRCGNLDPGAVIYMMRELGLSPDEVESVLYNESGLLGLSGLTNDVGLLQESIDPNAQFALDYFCMRTAQLMGMMAVALGGVDGIVFTGGIGENCDAIRSKILHHIAFLMPVEVHVIAANEEMIMAIHSIALMKQRRFSS